MPTGKSREGGESSSPPCTYFHARITTRITDEEFASLDGGIQDEAIEPDYLCKPWDDALLQTGCPLVKATIRESTAEVVRRLVDDEGQAVDQIDADGNTAVMMASREGDAECVLLLLQRRADILHANDAGRTALDLAIDGTGAGKLAVLGLLASELGPMLRRLKQAADLNDKTARWIVDEHDEDGHPPDDASYYPGAGHTAECRDCSKRLFCPACRPKSYVNKALRLLQTLHATDDNDAVRSGSSSSSSSTLPSAEEPRTSSTAERDRPVRKPSSLTWTERQARSAIGRASTEGRGSADSPVPESPSPAETGSGVGARVGQQFQGLISKSKRGWARTNFTRTGEKMNEVAEEEESPA